jgi:hypothetical protein
MTGSQNNPIYQWASTFSQYLFSLFGNRGGGGGTPSTPGGLGGDPPTGVYNGGVNLGVLPGAPYVASRQAPGTNDLLIYQLEGQPIARWELIIRDLSGGADLQSAEIEPGSVPNMIASGTLDVSHSRTVCLSPKVDSDTTAANLLSTWKGALHTSYLYNEFFAPICAAGSTADKSIVKLDQVATMGTWEDDFTVVPQTFTPPSHIVSLSSARINTLTPRLIAGFAGDPPKVLSGIDGSPTDAGSMHANLEPCFGVIESPLNSVTPGASTLLFLANGGIWSLSATAAIGDAPTRQLDEVNNGGFPIGVEELAGSAIRAYWCIPKEDLGTTHMCDTNAATSGAPTALGYILSTNLEGSDPQTLDIGLDYVLDAKAWRGGIVAIDGQTFMWHNGQKVNLGWNRERSWSSDAVVSLAGIGVDDERLFAMVVERTASTTYLSMDEYILEENAWYPVFERFELTSGRFPTFVRETPVLHYFDRGTATPAVHRMFWGLGLTSGDGITQWRSAPLFPSSYNPYYAQTTGNMPRPFASTGSLKTPIYHFMDGLPKIVSDIHFMGDLPGTDASVEIEVAEQLSTSLSFANNQTATFRGRDRWDKHHAYFHTPAPVDKLQFQVTGTQGSDSTRKTPNFVPFTVGGYVFYDGVVRTPAECESWRFP